MKKGIPEGTPFIGYGNELLRCSRDRLFNCIDAIGMTVFCFLRLVCT